MRRKSIWELFFCEDSAKGAYLFYWFITATKTRNIRTYFDILFRLGWALRPIDFDDGVYPRAMEKWIATKSKEEGYSRSRLPSFIKNEMRMVQLRATSDVTNRRKFDVCWTVHHCDN